MEPGTDETEVPQRQLSISDTATIGTKGNESEIETDVESFNPNTQDDKDDMVLEQEDDEESEEDDMVLEQEDDEEESEEEESGEEEFEQEESEQEESKENNIGLGGRKRQATRGFSPRYSHIPLVFPLYDSCVYFVYSWGYLAYFIDSESK